ncbi:MAG: acyltransferase [Bacteroidales bacterium]|nr:acyltransferase [Bacteroidales bacterium]
MAEKIKSNPKLKKLALRLLMPKNQARPRLWIKLIVNPLSPKIKKRRGSLIRKKTRMDLMPYNRFYLGRNSTVEDFSTINNGVGDVVIGDNTRIGISNILIGPVTIGNEVRMGQHIILSGLNHGYQNVTAPPRMQEVTISEIKVEDEAWIGANSAVIAGVTIGKHAVIAAGSVVTKDIPPYSVAVGNPARVIKKYNFDTKVWEKVES